MAPAYFVQADPFSATQGTVMVTWLLLSTWKVPLLMDCTVIVCWPEEKLKAVSASVAKEFPSLFPSAQISR